MLLKPIRKVLNLCGISVEVGCCTDVGRVRRRNEDSVGRVIPEDLSVLSKRGSLFLVCDGMGGHTDGDVAGRLGVLTTVKTYYEEATSNDPKTNLAHAIHSANRTIHTEAQGNHMGTTLVGLLIVDKTACIANVGDSRCYRLRNGELTQLTRDHSWVALQMALGEITLEEAEASDHKNILLRCLGEHAEVNVDIDVHPLLTGDIFLLCTDGLHGMVSREELRRHMLRMPPQKACESLVALANQNGGVDNISVQIVKVDIPDGQ